jgi:hypothetical protein
MINDEYGAVGGMRIDRGNSEKNLPQCRYVYHK